MKRTSSTNGVLILSLRVLGPATVSNVLSRPVVCCGGCGVGLDGLGVETGDGETVAFARERDGSR